MEPGPDSARAHFFWGVNILGQIREERVWSKWIKVPYKKNPIILLSDYINMNSNSFAIKSLGHKSDTLKAD